jgi:hypothetical protein
VPDDTEATGFLENIGKGIMRRGAQILGNTLSGASYFTPRVLGPKAASTMQEYAAEVKGAAAEVPVKSYYSLEGLKQDWEEGDFGGIAAGVLKEGAQQALHSVPDMLMMRHPLGALFYTLQQADRLATERAKNEGRAGASALDLAAQVPASTVITALDRYGLDKILGAAKGAGASEGLIDFILTVAKGTGKAAIAEGVTEGLQQIPEDLSTRLETAVPITGREVAENAAFAGALGAVGGGVMSTGPAAINASVDQFADLRTGLDTGEIQPPGAPAVEPPGAPVVEPPLAGVGPAPPAVLPQTPSAPPSALATDLTTPEGRQAAIDSTPVSNLPGAQQAIEEQIAQTKDWIAQLDAGLQARDPGTVVESGAFGLDWYTRTSAPDLGVKILNNEVLDSVLDATDADGGLVPQIPIRGLTTELAPGTIATSGVWQARDKLKYKSSVGEQITEADIYRARWEERMYNSVLPLVRDMFKKYTPDGKLVVRFDPASYGGKHTTVGNGTSVLTIGTDQVRYGDMALNSEQRKALAEAGVPGPRTPFFETGKIAAIGKVRLLGTTAHEFGHYLHAFHFEKAPAHIKRALLQEYESWLAEMKDKTFGDVIRTSDFMYAEARKYLPHELTVLAQDRDPRYWLSFREFFARRVSGIIKHKIDTGQLSPETRGFWMNLGAAVKRLFRELKQKYFKQGTTIEMWLDSLAAVNELRGMEAQFVDAQKVAPTPLMHESAVALTVTDEAEGDVTAPIRPTPSKVFESLNRVFGTKLDAGSLGKNQSRFNWFMKALLTLPQVERENWTVPGVRPFVDAARRWWGTKGILTSKWDGWVDQVRRSGYGKEDLSKLWRFANEVTVLSDELQRKLTPDELAAEARKVGGLDDGLMGLWQSGREMLNDALAKLEQLAEVRINGLWNERIAQEKSIVSRQEMIKARDEALKESAKDFAKMRNRDYWPLARFGTYAVHVKATEDLNFMGRGFRKGDTMLFELFETKGEQRKRKAELLKAHGGKVTVAADRVDESIYSFMGLPPTVLRAIEGEIMGAAQSYLTGDETVDADTLKMLQDQLNALRTVMLHFTPENAFKQRLLRRKGTRGFTDDGLRAMAALGQSLAGHIARAEHRGEMDDALKELDRYRKEMAVSEDPAMAQEGNKLSDLLNYLRRSQRDMLNPGNDLANLRAAGFLWYLGAVPRAAVVQVMQPIFTTYPWLATRYGDGRAVAEMAKGYSMIRQMMKGKGEDIGVHLENALREGMEAGILNQSLFTELAGLAEGSNLQRLLPGRFLKSQDAASMIRRVGYYSSYLFQKGEEVNRLVTFRAAYMLELRKLLGMEGATEREIAKRMQELVGTPEGKEAYSLAYTAGRSATEMTQGEYARWARPELMRGKKSAIFLFKMYSQIMNYFAIRDPGKWRFLGLQLAIAGALGLPFAEDLLDILNAATQGELCKTGDIRDCVREYVQELEMNPELLMHGLARVATPWDLSGSMSHGRVVPTVEPLTAAMMPGGDIRDSALRVQSEALGALFSIPLNWAKAVSSGEERDFEQAMPTVVRDVYRTYRRVREGGERGRAGEMQVEIDWGDPLDVVTHLAQAAGFRPAEIAAESEMRWAQKEAAKYWKGRREVVVGQFYHLYKVKEPGQAVDREAMADVMEGIRGFNDSVPYPEMKISATQLRKGLKASLQRQRLGEEGQAPEKKYRRLYSEVAEGFTPAY